MSQRSRFIFKVILFAGAIICVYLFLFHSGVFSLKHLEIKGKTTVSLELLRRTIPIPWGENIWQVDGKLLASQIEKNWFVKVIDVRRKLPSTLILEICDQVPVALVKSKNGMWLLSGSGLLWPLLKGAFVKEFSDLCKISYPEGTLSWFPGRETEDENLCAALLLIKFLGKVDRIEIDEDRIVVIFTRFEVIFPKTTKLKERLKRLKTVLDKFSSKEGKWLIDLRFDNMAIVKERSK